MGFYWKQDQLIARKGALSPPPSESDAKWTTFTLPLRTPLTLRSLHPFTFVQFLTSSLTFMSHLSSVSVYLNGSMLARVEKSSASPRKLDLPSNLKKKSDGGIMRISGIESMGA